MALDRALARRGGTRRNTHETAGVAPSTASKAADFPEKSDGGTPGTRGTPKRENAEPESAGTHEREARALAGITRRGKECLEDPNRCDCGGRCPWGF